MTKSVETIIREAVAAENPGSSVDIVMARSRRAVRFAKKAVEIAREELLASVEEAGKPYNISGEILDCIAKANAGADGERDGFALDMAMQYGFKIIDDDGDVFGVTAECLTGLMSVLGYRCRKERLAAREALAEKFPNIPYGQVVELKEAAIEAFDDVCPQGHPERMLIMRVVDNAVTRMIKELDDKLNHLGGLAAFEKFCKEGRNPQLSAYCQSADLHDPSGSGESDFTVKVRKGYAGLHGILVEALDQAQSGKGAERHNLGGDIPFEEQRMQTISELIGSVDGMAYQACKKITEGVNLPTLDRQVRELLGAINYIAGMIVYLRKQDNGEPNENKSAKYCAADLETNISCPKDISLSQLVNLRLDPAVAERFKAGLLDTLTLAKEVHLKQAVPRHLLMPVGTVFQHDGSEVMTPRIGNATIVEFRRKSMAGVWALPRRADEVDWTEVVEWRFVSGWLRVPFDGGTPVDLVGEPETRVRTIAKGFPEHSFVARACDVHWHNVELWRRENPAATA